LKILVTFALENEFAPWRKSRKFKRVSANSWDKTFAAQVGEASVRVLLTGAGRFASQRAMDQAFTDIPDACIVSGFAGALKPEYHPGQVLTAKTVGNSTGTRLMQCDLDLVSMATESGAFLAQRFIVSENVVATSNDKRRLGAFGDAVDMESLWVLAAAAQRSVRAVVIRAISDSVDADLPLDFDRVFDGQGKVSVLKVLGQIAKRPQRIAGLLRLAGDSEIAASALAKFLDAFIDSFSQQPFDGIAKAAAMAVN
jgi:adenosylhomocysteine nucleosidase